MTMTIFQCDFPFEGPWGAQLAEEFQGLARDIASEPSLVWKYWTENEDAKRAGGIYLFTNLPDAETYAKKHIARLTEAGVRDIVSWHFDVNSKLSAMTGAPCLARARHSRPL